MHPRARPFAQVGGAVALLAAVMGLSWLASTNLDPRPAAEHAQQKVQTLKVNQQQAKRDPLAVELEQQLTQDIRPLLQKYCYECHGNGRKKGGVALDGPNDIKSIMDAVADWETVVEVLNAQLMPPAKKPQPTAQERQKIQQWVEQAAEYYPPDAEPDPGWYTIHRLNRNEYRNTLRDLLGIDPAEHDLAAHLPPDDTGYGFDNIADVLSMSPLQFEKFLDAAEEAVRIAVGEQASEEPRPIRVLRHDGHGEPLAGGGHAMWSNSTLSGKHAFSSRGTYEIAIKAYGSQVEGVGPKMTVSVGGKTLKTVDVTAEPGEAAQVFKVKATVDRGEHEVGVGFINDQVAGGEDRNLWVESVTVLGPLRDKADRRAYDEIFFIQPTADDRGNRLPDAEGRRRITESQAARLVLERFATRAFRRHASAGDIAGLLGVYRDARDQGQSYDQAMRLAITAALVSPNFLYRPIANPRPDNPEFVYELDDYELASRLSYFLWSSMPDDRLLELARARRLSEPAVLRAQVKRMLIDPKSDAFVENFAGQWLLLRKLDGLEMDPSRFPGFDAELRGAMRQEAERFFADMVRENRDVTEFLDSDRAFINQRLAEHYGIPGVAGDDLRPVALPADSPRGGVLTMAATLTVTSHATRTSPVKRGDYVLAQLMGSAPPPPPPDIPPLEQATEKLGKDATLREQLAAHVADPNCAVCHKRLDPIGLAMENFDAIGAWRDTEQGKPIDASGELPGGIAFEGPVELKAVMLQQKDKFVENLGRMLLTYAVGRGTEPFDRPTIKQIAQACENDRYRMQTLIQAVVLSDAFRKARGRKAQP